MAEQLDVVGNWTEIKLAIIEEYAKAYAKILKRQSQIRHFAYIDAFAGAGTIISRDTGEEIPGSPAVVLDIKPDFNHYHLIEMDKSRAERLRMLTASRNDVSVYEGDCNSILIKEVFPNCRYEEFRRALCIFDPYGLNPNWSAVETAGKMRSIEIILNFMIMDANRNVLWSNPEKVMPKQIKRMNVFWGDDSWRQVGYESRRGLFGDMMEKRTNADIIQAYRSRLKEKAGFEYVPEPMPMKNLKGTPIYYLFFASHNRTGDKIASLIFHKYRALGY